MKEKRGIEMFAEQKVFFAVYDSDTFAFGSGSSMTRSSGSLREAIRFVDINMLGLSAMLVDLSSPQFGAIRFHDSCVFAFGRTMTEAKKAVADYVKQKVEEHKEEILGLSKVLGKMSA